MVPIIERARAIAEDVLFPAAMGTDASDLLPKTHLDLLAREGFYGIAGPVEAGGLDLDPTTTTAVVEALASGCLTTTFVWLQHRNPVRAMAASRTPGLRERWLAQLCRGERRAGIALAGNRPGPPILRATRTRTGDVLLDGEAPWVSGWGLVDVILVTARDRRHGGVAPRRCRGRADDAGRTAAPRRARTRAPRSRSGSTVTSFRQQRVVGEEPHAEVLARDAEGLRLNGSLALGVADRCCRSMGPTGFDEQLVAVRRALDGAATEQLPAARAAASDLAMRAATPR